MKRARTFLGVVCDLDWLWLCCLSLPSCCYIHIGLRTSIVRSVCGCNVIYLLRGKHSRSCPFLEFVPHVVFLSVHAGDDAKWMAGFLFLSLSLFFVAGNVHALPVNTGAV
ncbi:hypothetical protein KP509_36G049700 [Ceratopteris richardii]|uniref:Secreted protein n=1 Tax=Ceratopteris richardii TaxID=49495 RepID=A0A8T2QBI1_CERRI|nr:hypothetical protein KP509_36G049700 [Ceratopteris richardii]